MKLLGVSFRRGSDIARKIVVPFGSDFALQLRGEANERIVFAYNANENCYHLCPTVDMDGDVVFDGRGLMGVGQFMRQQPGRSLPLDDDASGRINIGDDVSILFCFEESSTETPHRHPRSSSC